MEEVGTHFIRSGRAMTMKLANVATYTIKLIGRWKSDSFLKYIRKRVKEFSLDISDRMIEHGHFSHIPHPCLKFISSESKLAQRPKIATPIPQTIKKIEENNK